MMICPPPNEPPSEPAPARSPVPEPVPVILSLEPPEALAMQSITDEIPIAQATIVNSAESSIYETATGVMSSNDV